MTLGRHLVLIVTAALLCSFAALETRAQENRDNQPTIKPKKMPSEPAEKPPEEQPSPAATPEEGESSSVDTQINLEAHPTLPEPMKRDDRAFSHYDPHQAEKDVEVGKYYLKMKNYRAAIERFNSALENKPNDAEATLGLAQTQEKLDMPGKAYLNYQKCIEILPNGPLATQAQQGIKRVQPLVKAAGTNDKDMELAHDIDVGETYLSLNNFEAAHERFEDAMRLAPQNSLVIFRMAQSLRGLQRLDEARLYFRKYLEMQPEGRMAADAKKAVGDIDALLGKEK